MSPRHPTPATDPARLSDASSMVLTAWFTADAAAREPEGLLDRTLARTATTRQGRRHDGPARWLPRPIGMRTTLPRPVGLVVVMLLGVVVLLSAALSGGTPTTPPVPYLTAVASISAGDGHTCALTVVGQVVCWGVNYSGQLGDGTVTDRSIPVRVDGLTDATQIAAGANHTCALIAGGAVRCWGAGPSVGDQTVEIAPSPVEVQGLPLASAIAAGGFRSCAVAPGGRVWCWGSLEEDGPPAVPLQLAGVEGVTAIAVGYYQVCGILTDGRVRCWDEDGVVSDVPELVGATAIAAGQESMSLPHWCAIVAGGHVRCWGGDEYQQLGAGGATVDSAVPVEAIGIEGAATIGTGGAHSCAVLATGRVRCWGWNRNGELGDPASAESDVSVPVEVVDVDDATDVAMGWAHTCAVGTDTQVRCWGQGAAGRLGNATADEQEFREPQYVLAATP